MGNLSSTMLRGGDAAVHAVLREPHGRPLRRPQTRHARPLFKSASVALQWPHWAPPLRICFPSWISIRLPAALPNSGVARSIPRAPIPEELISPRLSHPRLSRLGADISLLLRGPSITRTWRHIASRFRCPRDHPFLRASNCSSCWDLADDDHALRRWNDHDPRRFECVPPPGGACIA